MIEFVDVDNLRNSPLFTETYYRIPYIKQENLTNFPEISPCTSPDISQEDPTLLNHPFAWNSYPLSIASSSETDLPDDRELDLEVETILRNASSSDHDRNKFTS